MEFLINPYVEGKPALRVPEASRPGPSMNSVNASEARS